MTRALAIGNTASNSLVFINVNALDTIIADVNVPIAVVEQNVHSALKIGDSKQVCHDECSYRGASTTLPTVERAL